MSPSHTGTPLVLLHGVGLDHRMWHRCIPHLSGRYRLIAPDLPGHGDAGRVEPGVSLTDLADRVADQVPAGAHLVGFSLGALIAQQLALSEPARISSLTLVSSVANRSGEQATAVTGRLRAAEQDFDAAARAAVDRWMPPAWQASDPDLAQDLAATLRKTDRSSYLACYRVFATADAELWPQLPRITTPTLCITGGDDTGSTPAMTRSLATALPHARAAVVPEARHLLPLQAPQALATEILAHTEEVAE